MKPHLKLITFSLFLSLWSVAIKAQGIRVTNLSGDSVAIKIRASDWSSINEGSSLRRSWIVMNDDSCPIQIVDAGIQFTNRSGFPHFEAVGSLKIAKEIRAYEVRHVLYDVFGERMTTLSHKEVTDLSSGITRPLKESWGWEGKTQLLTVVTFVAQVRAGDGTIWRYRQKEITDELERIELGTASVLEQKTYEK